MKQIFIAIRDRLATLVPDLQYVDRDWHQLQYEQAPIKWPCCLIDLATVDYSQGAHLTRLADATLSVTIATQTFIRSSAKAPSKDDAFDILDIVEQVCCALEGYRVPDTTQALTRTRLQHTYSDKGHDVYTLTFTTAWVEQPQQESEAVKASPLVTARFLQPT